MSDNFPLTFLLQVKNEMASGLSQATSQLKSMGSEVQSAGAKVKQSGIGIGAGVMKGKKNWKFCGQKADPYWFKHHHCT